MLHGRLLIPLALAMLAAGAALSGVRGDIQHAVAAAAQQAQPGDTTNPGFCFGVLGQVAKPAVYQFPVATVRLKHLVSAAGGITDRATGAARLVRSGLKRQPTLLMPGADVRLMPGDIVVFDARPATSSGIQLSKYSPGVSPASGIDAKSQAAEVQLAFVGLMDHPVIVKMPSEQATVAQIVSSLRQSPEVAKTARVVQTSSPSAAGAQSADGQIQLTSGSIVVFDRNLIVAESLPEGLPGVINAAEPPGVANTRKSGKDEGPILQSHGCDSVSVTPVSLRPPNGAINKPKGATPQHSTAATSPAETETVAGEPAAWSPLAAPALSAKSTDASNAEKSKPSADAEEALPTFGEQALPEKATNRLPVQIRSYGPARNADSAATHEQGVANQIDPFPPIPYNVGDEQSAESAAEPSAEAQINSRAGTLSALPSDDFHPSQRATNVGNLSGDDQSSGELDPSPAKKTRTKPEKKSWLKWLGIPVDLTVVGILGTLAAVVALGILGYAHNKQTNSLAASPVQSPAPPAVAEPVPESDQPEQEVVAAEKPKSVLHALACLIKNQLPIVEEPCLHKPNLTFFGRAAVANKTMRIDAGHGGQAATGSPQIASNSETLTHDRTAAAKSASPGPKVPLLHSSPPVAAAGRSLLDRVLSSFQGPGAL